MQHDEVIWQVIRHNHCSFMSKIETGIFCRNQYNVTGICNRSSCPLANSRYATIRVHDGVFYLYMKTIERAHMPNKLWERVKLPRNYEKALEIIDKHLMYWPKFLVHKTKQRLTKMTQIRIRMRKLVRKPREKIMTMPSKQKKRESRLYENALRRALLDKAIEKELLDRLSDGVYQEIYPAPSVDEVLNKNESQEPATEYEDEEEEHGTEYVEYLDGIEEEDDMEDFDDLAIGETGIDVRVEDEDDEEFVKIHRKRDRNESSVPRKKLDKDLSAGKLRKKSRVHVEVEHEETDGRHATVH